MPVNIRGKQYSTVAERMTEWHRIHKNSKISTDVEHLADGACVARAVGIPDLNHPDRTFTGHACERPEDSAVHKHNHIEIAETSAVGRMLAFAGFGADGSIASAEEVTREIAREQRSDDVEPSDYVAPVAVSEQLKPAHDRIDAIEGVAGLVDAAEKICACVKVDRYTRAEGAELVRHALQLAIGRAHDNAGEGSDADRQSIERILSTEKPVVIDGEGSAELVAAAQRCLASL